MRPLPPPSKRWDACFATQCQVPFSSFPGSWTHLHGVNLSMFCTQAAMLSAPEEHGKPSAPSVMHLHLFRLLPSPHIAGVPCFLGIWLTSSTGGLHATWYRSRLLHVSSVQALRNQSSHATAICCLSETAFGHTARAHTYPCTHIQEVSIPDMAFGRQVRLMKGITGKYHLSMHNVVFRACTFP